MFPKCKLCGTRVWRLVGTIHQGRLDKFLYQCSNGHIYLLPSVIVETPNPLEMVE
jgi:hypothetical protein